jgi:hypothetical protein
VVENDGIGGKAFYRAIVENDILMFSAYDFEEKVSI